MSYTTTTKCLVKRYEITPDDGSEPPSIVVAHHDPDGEDSHVEIEDLNFDTEHLTPDQAEVLAQVLLAAATVAASGA